MKLIVYVLFTCFALSLPCFAQKPQDCGSQCKTVEQALVAVQDIKVGMTRNDLEKHFEMDGGFNFRGDTRYVFKGCSYLKITVEFILDPGVSRNFSPKDTVKSVSKLFVEYPIMD